MRPYLVLLLAAACASPEPSVRTDSAHPRRDVAAAPPTAQVSAPATPDYASVRFDAAGHPILPLIFADECEGEGCSTKGYDVVACLPAELLASRSDDADVVAHIAQDDTASVEQQRLVVPQVGIVVLRKSFVLDWDIGSDDDRRMPRPDTVRFHRGDTLYVLHYGELGSWYWSYKGTPHWSYQFWADASDHSLGAPNSDSTYAVGQSSPETENWWLVRPRHGNPGLWHADDRVELQSPEYMQHWNDSCEQVRARAADSTKTSPAG